MAKHFMTLEQTASIRAPLTVVWQTLSDPQQWHQWGLFQNYETPATLVPGHTGKVSANMFTLPYVVDTVEAPKHFQLRYRLPGARLSVNRELSVVHERRTQLTQTAAFEGALGEMYAWLFGIRLREVIPEKLAKARELCEQEYEAQQS